MFYDTAMQLLTVMLLYTLPIEADFIIGVWWSQCEKDFSTHQVADTIHCNRLVSQMRAPLAACPEPAGKLWQLCKVLYVFEHKTQYVLIHAPFTSIVVFWHIVNVPPMIS